MKNLIFTFTIALFFCSCAVTKITQIPAKQALLGFDFRTYTEKGFLITPYSYPGEYEAHQFAAEGRITEEEFIEWSMTQK